MTALTNTSQMHTLRVTVEGGYRDSPAGPEWFLTVQLPGGTAQRYEVGRWPCANVAAFLHEVYNDAGFPTARAERVTGWSPVHGTNAKNHERATYDLRVRVPT